MSDLSCDSDQIGLRYLNLSVNHHSSQVFDRDVLCRSSTKKVHVHEVHVRVAAYETRTVQFSTRETQKVHTQ